MAHLRAGTMPPDQFDFAALRTEGVRWGKTALAALIEDSAPAIAEAARRAPDPNSIDTTEA